MRRLPLPLLLLVALVTGAACGSVTPYAAKVNDAVIAEDDLQEELSAIAANARYVEGLESQGLQVRGSGRGTFNTQFVAQVLTRQVLLELVRQESVRRGVEPSADRRRGVAGQVAESYGGQEIFSAFPKAYQDLVVERTARVEAVQEALSGTGQDEAAVRRHYEQNRERYSQTCVRHILFAVVGPDGRPDQQATQAQADALRAQAEQVRAELEAGGEFTAAAAAHSADAGTKTRGGDLGCQSGGRFVPEFEDAMRQLEPGEISQPVRTQFGFHLIQVTERKVRSFEEAADEVRQELQQQGGQRLDQALGEMVSAARISVNPRYGHFEKQGRPRVVPPSPPDVPGGAPAEPVPLGP